ncbi:Aminopeptidase C [Mycoplasmopsis meleagridis]|uniref:Aminopeptidase n=1 Tax=Mycoplasmopsis meleagridis ATCC 25294 TaxID=1264554 RepID=A0A0F5H0U2_9BACT|nr:C1 family peptidase [Mycoplasmopsis meleagridis]KKB26899.1 Aminopeptidase C [Mycoplasmopsis meleagridis ATCC 25294]OAD18271.1 Aminopeptidase C [Mycoplasmopsis meleagridis]VEU77555.1 Aminopeptidase C [Mycoplasmopsis meleagridis]
MEIKKSLIENFYKKYQANSLNQVLENAITKNGILNATFNNKMKREHNFIFNVEVDKIGITNQKNSGRCWIFSALNILKVRAAKELNTKELEFSQNYLFFWDKLEKANNIFEIFISNPKLDFDDRLFGLIMDGFVSDGGYWEWAQSLIHKYGVVPKSVMNEVVTSESSEQLNSVLKIHIVSTIKEIKRAINDKNSLGLARKIKESSLERIFEINAKVLGLPPLAFDYEYKDKDNKYVKLNNQNPVDFAKTYCKSDYLNYVNLLDDPRDKYPKNTLLVSKYFASVIEGKKLSQIKVDIKEIKKAIIQSLKDNNPVWFDCDVAAFSDRKLGILDTEIYSINETLRIYNNLTKADRINYRISAPTHAMTFVGVNLDEENNPLQWEIENSWGEEVGKKGYFSMSDKWFDEYVFGAILDPKYVDPKILEEVKNNKIIEIEPWDVLS